MYNVISAKDFEREKVIKLFENAASVKHLLKERRFLDLSSDRVLMTVFPNLVRAPV